MFVQIAAVVLGFYSAINTLEVWQMLLLVVLFVGVLNVYNFMDGINGMLAAYSFVLVTSLVILLILHSSVFLNRLYAVFNIISSPRM